MSARIRTGSSFDLSSAVCTRTPRLWPAATSKRKEWTGRWPDRACRQSDLAGQLEIFCPVAGVLPGLSAFVTADLAPKADQGVSRVKLRPPGIASCSSRGLAAPCSPLPFSGRGVGGEGFLLAEFVGRSCPSSCRSVARCAVVTADDDSVPRPHAVAAGTAPFQLSVSRPCVPPSFRRPAAWTQRGPRRRSRAVFESLEKTSFSTGAFSARTPIAEACRRQ